MPGDPRFHEVLKQIATLHDVKQADYGKEHDPFSNVRSSEDFGIPGWIGCAVRMNDKMRRLQAFAKKGTLVNEPLEDSFLDLAVYAVIGLILYREATLADVVNLKHGDDHQVVEDCFGRRGRLHPAGQAGGSGKD